MNFSLPSILLCASLFSITAPPASARVYTGMEVFLDKYTNMVAGKRVGLVTNPTGVNANLQHTADLLKSSGKVNLTALLAPEHGIRGNVAAGEKVSGGIDAKTGLPIFTLYGNKDHKPTKEALDKVDVIIYDIQDVGSRAYTYIWHLAECMSAAAAAGKTVIVLDRPNPLGANVVDGPVSEEKYLSFIGLYPIPRVYGMTVGELALYLNAEEKINCKLHVIPMANFKRGMSWEQTGLPWVMTSPHIPTPQAAYSFAATGTIGEIGCLSTGIGYTIPFQAVAAPWINAEAAALALNRLQLPGVRFRPVYYKPYYAAFKDQNISGVQLHVTDPGVFKPATTETAILCYLQKAYPTFLKWNPAKLDIFDKSMGTASVRKAVIAGQSYKQIADSWEKKSSIFSKKRAKYLIYK